MMGATDQIEGISIVIPAFNEVKGITSVLTDISTVMQAANINYEIIVVDDGSTDGTYEAITGERIIRLKHEINRGYGAALKSGILKARYGTIVITDADGTYSAQDIPNLVSHIGPYDMVVGARVGEVVQISWLRRPAKWMLNLLANYLIGCKIPDLNSGLRAFKKSIALHFFNILPSGFSFTSTLTLAMLINGYLVKYLPINYYKRVGWSKINPIKDTLYFFSLIIRTVMYFEPLKIFLPPSLVLLVIGIGLALYQILILRNVTTITVLFFVTGLQIGAIGLLADLIDKRCR
jgi:glycosyltransferase involved in cell wall biosynthesis